MLPLALALLQIVLAEEVAHTAGASLSPNLSEAFVNPIDFVSQGGGALEACAACPVSTRLSLMGAS